MCKVQEPPPAHHGRARKRKRPIIRTHKDKPQNLCNLPIEQQHLVVV